MEQLKSILNHKIVRNIGYFLIKGLQYLCYGVIIFTVLLFSSFFFMLPIKEAFLIFFSYSISWLPIIVIMTFLSKQLNKLANKVGNKTPERKESLSDKIKYLQSQKFKDKVKQKALKEDKEVVQVEQKVEKRVIAKGREL